MSAWVIFALGMNVGWFGHMAAAAWDRSRAKRKAAGR